VRRQHPGDKVEIKFLRGGQPMSTRATLAGRNLSGEQAARFKMMNRMGTIVSRRADNFPFVFQHDAPLFPEHCGGPVVDLDGNVIGINIARQGRASSLAIPASRMKEIVKGLTRSNVAARP
jgi:S1-C subfamily serine protease